jgi:dolichyl-phosphate beta-glucosyltransferase
MSGSRPLQHDNLPTVTVVIPAYNEARTIGGTLGELFAYFDARRRDVEVIVAADGNDGTREAVRELAQSQPRLSVIGSGERRGKGRGIREGVQRARGDIVGFVDADNKTPISEFDKFAGLFDNGYDLVIGPRGLRESQIERAQPLYRRLGSKVFAFCMHALVGLDDIVDTQCGFKFFRRDVAADLFARQRIDGYMFDVEILHLAKRAGYRLAQVPVRWRDDADSRLQLVRGNLQNAADLVRIRLGRYPEGLTRQQRCASS